MGSGEVYSHCSAEIKCAKKEMGEGEKGNSIQVQDTR